jgi:glycosyltransferase involved in cell wall biosynthesis
LEYDDLQMLEAMGIEWFSTGVYVKPKNPLKSLVSRGTFNKSVDLKCLHLFNKENQAYIPFENALVKIPKELVQAFDIIWVTHTFPNIEHNWEAFKGKPVIWRTYNQQDAAWEAKAKQYLKEGLKIVRMGNTESNRLTFAGQDEVIRAYVDPEIFYGWKGARNKVLTFHNRFDQRLKMSLNGCSRAYIKLRENMPSHLFELYGFGNAKNELSLGPLPYSQQVLKYRSSKIYLSLNSESAVYTNSFMEALMSGMPVVTFGPKLSNVLSNPELSNSYEVPYLVKNGEEAIISDDLDEIKDSIEQILRYKQLGEWLGKAARKRALQLFGKRGIMKQWHNFFKKL